MSKKQSSSDFPGSLALNLSILVLGIIQILLCFIPLIPNIAVSIMSGLGSAMFIAGFLGYINVRLLSKEISDRTTEPFEDLALLNQIRGAGLIGIARSRSEIIEKSILRQIDRENQEVVIVGSSLLGILGKGLDAQGHNREFRNTLINACLRNVNVYLLMTHPQIAYLRANQEGRSKGDIEYEIIINLIYLVKLKCERNEIGSKLKIGLYKGTPTIFMITTSDFMLINPYPYYSKAYESFSFAIEGQSIMYQYMYTAHFKRAWSDNKMTELIDDNTDSSIKSLISLVNGKNLLGEPLIPNENDRQELLQLIQGICKK